MSDHLALACPHPRTALEAMRHQRGCKKYVCLTLSWVRDSSLVTRHGETQSSAEKPLGLCHGPKSAMKTQKANQWARPHFPAWYCVGKASETTWEADEMSQNGFHGEGSPNPGIKA